MITCPDSFRRPAARNYNSGLATLLFCLIMLSSATLLIFTLTRTSLAEQRIIGNEYRLENLHQACESGLEYGMAWLRQQTPLWQDNGHGQKILLVPVPPNNLEQHHDIQIEVTYISNDITSPFLQIQAQAQYSHSHNPYTISQFVYYKVINQPDKGFSTQVISVPGTWHDYP